MLKDYAKKKEADLRSEAVLLVKDSYSKHLERERECYLATRLN